MRWFVLQTSKRVTLLIGSHKRNGFSRLALEYLKTGFEKSGITPDVIDVLDLDLTHCLDCGYCSKHQGKCVISDDMNHVYESMQTADHMVVITPVYYNGVTSRLKVLIDRTQMIFMSIFSHGMPYPINTVEETKGAYIVAFGGPRPYDNQFFGVEESLKWVFKNLKMPKRSQINFSGTDHLKKGLLTDEMKCALDKMLQDIIER